jgi:hypothetical protein
MMAMTMIVARISESTTSWTAPPMNTASSDVTRSDTPSGSEALSSATAARTPSEIASVFDCACRMMPSPTPVSPLMRSALTLSAGPKITSATSPTRVARLMRMASTSSALSTLASARTSRDLSVSARLPAGASSATVRSAVSRSAIERPRTASACGSMRTRTSGSRSP